MHRVNRAKKQLSGPLYQQRPQQPSPHGSAQGSQPQSPQSEQAAVCRIAASPHRQTGPRKDTLRWPTRWPATVVARPAAEPLVAVTLATAGTTAEDPAPRAGGQQASQQADQHDPFHGFLSPDEVSGRLSTWGYRPNNRDNRENRHNRNGRCDRPTFPRISTSTVRPGRRTLGHGLDAWRRVFGTRFGRRCRLDGRATTMRLGHAHLGPETLYPCAVLAVAGPSVVATVARAFATAGNERKARRRAAGRAVH